MKPHWNRGTVSYLDGVKSTEMEVRNGSGGTAGMKAKLKE